MMHRLEYFLRILFPSHCIFCGNLLEIDAKIEICPYCYSKIPFINAQVRIANRIPYCDDVVCLFEYTGLIRESIKRYKFMHKASYYRAFAQIMADSVKKMTNSKEFDIIIGVPLFKRRLQMRGYNQSCLISEAVSKKMGIKERSDLLERIRDTNSQSLLNKEQRRENIKGAFRVKNKDSIRDKNILLIDDILTTGNTISECSRVLKEAGAKRVIAGIIASGSKFISDEKVK